MAASPWPAVLSTASTLLRCYLISKVRDGSDFTKTFMGREETNTDLHCLCHSQHSLLWNPPSLWFLISQEQGTD
ncbi:hypothetical protein B0T24DRAFT_618739 [Lasiosphaeria ovina]|uniref:Uncharacterized protein n=1 Tax=Lasiosphaeria ovina TaxID=92902 RepID=A0AAE0KGS5_9PEZI|nr:hypothetical protein B0T24DRAFT_618739 [Lasiosphaeria ovina]